LKKWRKTMAKISATKLTNDYCEERGWPVDVCERTIPGARIKKDLFGFIDQIAIVPMDYPDEEGGILAIQATTGSNNAARIKKIVFEHDIEAHAWTASGGIIEVWAWSRIARAKRGEPKWRLKRTRITHDLMDEMWEKKRASRKTEN
jgi:hypothetical protein